MRVLGCVALCVVLISCDSSSDRNVELTTVDEAATELRPIEHPPRLAFDVSRRDEDVSRDGAIERLQKESEKGNYTENLPFAPLIAMDPVNGDKISIELETPTAVYDDRIYYFASEANKRTFLQNPEEYTKGPFSKY